MNDQCFVTSLDGAVQRAFSNDLSIYTLAHKASMVSEILERIDWMS